MFAASSREIEDACLTAPAIPRGAAAWQDRVADTPEVLILVENSAPFPRQSHARDAVLCEMFMLCVLQPDGHYVSSAGESWPVQRKQSAISSDPTWSCISWRVLAWFD